MNEVFKLAVTPAIRAVLLVATGWLVSKGIWSESIAGKVLEAAVPAVVLYIWAMFEKYKSRILLNTAAAMPQAVSVAAVKQAVKDGKAPPANVPQDRVPYLKGEKPTAGYSTDRGWPQPGPPPPPPNGRVLKP